MAQFDEVSRSLNAKPLLNLDFQQYEKYTKRSWLEGTNEEGMGLGTQFSTVLGNVFHNFLAFTSQVNTFLFGPNDKKDQWKWYDNDRVAVSIGKKLLKAGLYMNKAGDCSNKIVTIKDGSEEIKDQNMVDVIKSQLIVVRKICAVLKNGETSESLLAYVKVKIEDLDKIVNPIKNDADVNINNNEMDVNINNNEVGDRKDNIENEFNRENVIVNYEDRIFDDKNNFKNQGNVYGITVNVDDEDSVEKDHVINQQKQDNTVKSETNDIIYSDKESIENFKKLDEQVDQFNEEMKKGLNELSELAAKNKEEKKDSLVLDKAIEAPTDGNSESLLLKNNRDGSDEDFVKDFQELFTVEKSQIDFEINEAKSIDAPSKVVEENSPVVEEAKIKKIDIKSLFSSPIVYNEKDRKAEAKEKAMQEQKAAEKAALEQAKQKQKANELAVIKQAEQEEVSEFAALDLAFIRQTNQWKHRVNSYLQMLHRLKTSEVYSNTIYPEKAAALALEQPSAIVEFKPIADESKAIEFNLTVNLSDDMFEISTDEDRQSIVANTTIKIEIIDLIFNINILGNDEDVKKFINFLDNLSEKKKFQLMKKAVEAAKQETTPEAAKLSFGQKFIELLKKAPLEKEALLAIEEVAEDSEVKVQDVTNEIQEQPEILEQPGIQKQAEIQETVLSREEKIKGLKEEIAELMLWAKVDTDLRNTLGQISGSIFSSLASFSKENRDLQGYIDTILNKKDISYLEFIAVATKVVNLINKGLKQYDFPDGAKILWTDSLITKIAEIKEEDVKIKEAIAKDKAKVEEFKKGKLEELKIEISYLIDVAASHSYLKDSFGQFMGRSQDLNECISKLKSKELTQAELFDNLLSATSLINKGFEQSPNPFAQSFEMLNGKMLAIAELDSYIDELEKKYQAL